MSSNQTRFYYKKQNKTLSNTDKYRYWFTFEQLPLELDPLSQSMKLFNQNVNTGSNLSSSNISDQLCTYSVFHYFVLENRAHNFFVPFQGGHSETLKEYRRYKRGYVSKWLSRRRIKGFYSVTTATDFRQGARSLMQVRFLLIAPHNFKFCRIIQLTDQSCTKEINRKIEVD